MNGRISAAGVKSAFYVQVIHGMLLTLYSYSVRTLLPSAWGKPGVSFSASQPVSHQCRFKNPGMLWDICLWSAQSAWSPVFGEASNRCLLIWKESLLVWIVQAALVNRGQTTTTLIKTLGVFASNSSRNIEERATRELNQELHTLKGSFLC